MSHTLSVAVPLIFLAPMISSTAPRHQSTTSVLQESEDDLTVGEFLRVSEAKLGIPILFEPRDVDVTVHFVGDLKVSDEDYRAFFETVLRQAGFLVVEVGSEQDPIYRVIKISGQGRAVQSCRTLAKAINARDLDQYTNRQVLVTTTLSTQHLTAGEVVTTLTPYFDNITGQVRHIGGTNTLVMTGFASNLAAIAQLVGEIDQPRAIDPSAPRRGSRRAPISLAETHGTKLHEALFYKSGSQIVEWFGVPAQVNEGPEAMIWEYHPSKERTVRIRIRNDRVMEVDAP